MSLITIKPRSLNYKRVFQPVTPKTLPYWTVTRQIHHFQPSQGILNHNTENSTIYTFNQWRSAFNHSPTYTNQTHTTPFSTIVAQEHSTISGRDAPDLTIFFHLASRRALNPSWLRHLNHEVEHHRSIPMVKQYELWFWTKMHGFELLGIVRAQLELYHGGTKPAMVVPPNL